jgi:hypothetical protein
VATGSNRLDFLFAAQARYLEKVRELNQNWFDLARSEAALASELAIKLMAGRSAPEVSKAYQEWASPHLARAAEDGKRFLADGQELTESGTRLLSEAFRPNGRGISNDATKQ